MNNLDKELRRKILEATDNGLLIICDLTKLHPSDVKETGGKGFSRKAFRSPLRADDEHPSAVLFKGAQGVWGIKDFALPGKDGWVDCFELYMREQHISNFYIALLELARKYNVEVDGKVTPRKPFYTKLPAGRIAEVVETSTYATTGTDGVQYFHIQFKEECTIEDVSVFNPKVTGTTGAAVEFFNAVVEAMQHYNLKSVEYYDVVTINKDGTATGYRKTSHQGYPIFAFHLDTWGKVYEPYASEWTTKDGSKIPPQRFRHYGAKPNRHIYGMDQLMDQVADTRTKEYERMLEDDAEFNRSDKNSAAKAERKKLKKKADKIKIPAIVICTGGSDGINIKAMGYPAVWSNSETELILPDEMRELKSYAEEIFYVGDNDKAGQDATHKIGMLYLDIKLIRLPKELGERDAWNNKPCKDVKDFARYYSPGDFAGLMRVAYAYQYWQARIDSKGQMRGHEFDSVNAKHFLSYQGFFRCPNKYDRLQFDLVKVDKNILRLQNEVSIKNYLDEFAYETRQEKSVVKAVANASLKVKDLVNSVPQLKVEYKRGTANAQYFFFSDCAWEITATGAIKKKPTDTGRFVWEHDIYFAEAKTPEIQAPFFSVFKDADGKPQIKIHRQDNPFAQYLINTSRVHWKKEFDAAAVSHYEKNAYYAERGLNTLTGKDGTLTPDEVRDQELHFLSKVTALGYLIHDYKIASEAYIVFATDNTEREINESHGGTGKSIFGEACRKLVKTEYFPGRRIKMDDQFHYQGVTDKTKLIWYDDISMGFPVDSIFSDVTNGMKVRPQYSSFIEIPFADSAKYLMTSNFNIKSTDPSVHRRMWYLGFSDFYHSKSSSHGGSKKVSEDVGQIFQAWSQEHEASFFNFMKDCEVAWLALGQVEPPMKDIHMQNLRMVMGSSFMEWGAEFLLPKVNTRVAGTVEPRDIAKEDCDTFIPKEFARVHFAEYLKKTNNKEQATPDSFRRKIKAFAEFHGLTLDPPGLKNTRGSIEVRIKDADLPMYSLSREGNCTFNCHYLLRYVTAQEKADMPPVPMPDGELPF